MHQSAGPVGGYVEYFPIHGGLVEPEHQPQAGGLSVAHSDGYVDFIFGGLTDAMDGDVGVVVAAQVTGEGSEEQAAQGGGHFPFLGIVRPRPVFAGGPSGHVGEIEIGGDLGFGEFPGAALVAPTAGQDEGAQRTQAFMDDGLGRGSGRRIEAGAALSVIRGAMVSIVLTRILSRSGSADQQGGCNGKSGLEHRESSVNV